MTAFPRLSIIPGWVVTDPRLKGRDLQVLCLLGRHADTETGWCRRSQVKMAAQLNCARSTVQGALDRLAAIGVVEIREEISADGRDSAHSYRVLYDPEPSADVLESHAASAWQDDFSEENSPIATTEMATPPAGISAPPADPESAPPADSGSAPINDSPLTPPSERQRESAGEAFEKASGDGADGRDARLVERDFMKFFLRWPSAPLDSQPAARRAWHALTPDERHQAALRLGDYLAAAKQAGRKYNCAAGVYLAEKRWQNLPPPPAEPQKAMTAKPLGKAGMATRLAELCRPMATGWPLPPPTVRMLIEAGGPQGEREMAQRRERYGWPKVFELNEAIRRNEPIVARPDMIAAGADFVAVDMAGPVGLAWRRFFARQKFPDLPDGVKFAYFPPVEAEGHDLDAAVAAAFWGFKGRIEGHASAA